jgi:hypothetical protein
MRSTLSGLALRAAHTTTGTPRRRHDHATACPQFPALAHTSGRATVTMSYDGSAAAKWVAAGGKSGAVNLRCGG